MRKRHKLLGLLLLIVVIAAVYYFAHAQVFLLIRSDPALAHIYTQIVGRTALGLFYISTISSLFFITVVAEAVVLYFLYLGFNPVLVTVLFVAGSAVAMVFNYMFGFVVGERILRYLLKKNYDKWKAWTKKYGGLLIVGGNAVIFPSEIISPIIGGLRYPFGKFIKYTLVGRAIKCALLYFVYLYFMQEFLPFLLVYFPK